MKKIYPLVFLLLGLAVAVILVKIRQDTRSKAGFGPVSKINIAWYDLKNKAGFSADAINEIGQIVNGVSYQWGVSSAGIGSLDIHSDNRYVEFIPNGNPGRADIWVAVDGGITTSVGIMVNADGSFSIAEQLATPTPSATPIGASPTATPSATPIATATPIPTPTPSPTSTVCIQDAKQCPDGSWVGRTGPGCTFVCNDGQNGGEGDLNNNGKVDIFDYNILVSNFGKTSSVADIDGNGKVDIFDYNILVADFGKGI